MKPEEDILLRARRLLAEAAALGQQCAEFYARQDKAEQALADASRDAAILSSEDVLPSFGVRR